MAFRGVDYLCVDSLFNEQELLVRQTARQFVDERVLPAIRDCYREARFPGELIPEMGRLGFFGANARKLADGGWFPLVIAAAVLAYLVSRHMTRELPESMQSLLLFSSDGSEPPPPVAEVPSPANG